MDSQLVTLHAADGTDFSAFHAVPAAHSGAAMLILPDVRGLHKFYEELALRFAEAGVEALTIDYFGRTAGRVEGRAGDFDHQPHVGQVAWPSLLADISAGREYLGRSTAVRGCFSVGFCFGGRLSFLLGSIDSLAMSGVIGFYGWPVGESRGVPAPINEIDKLRAPVLGIFGGADPGITEEIVDSYRQALAGAGKDAEIVTYPDAPHSFFDRKAADFNDASTDAWRRVLEFIGDNTPQENAAAA